MERRLKMKTHLLLIAGLFSGVIVASADVLELKNGTVLSGTYTGGNADSINFQTSAGMQVISPGQAVALTFTARTPAAAGAPGAAAASAPAAAAASSVTLPAG